MDPFFMAADIMTDETKRWFIEKVAQSPEYIAGTFLPAIEKMLKKEEDALHEANRKGTFDQIKYAQGRLDGAEKSVSVIDGLKASEGKSPDPGLRDRISRWMSGQTETPASLG